MVCVVGYGWLFLDDGFIVFFDGNSVCSEGYFCSVCSVFGDNDLACWTFDENDGVVDGVEVEVINGSVNCGC